MSVDMTLPIWGGVVFWAVITICLLIVIGVLGLLVYLYKKRALAAEKEAAAANANVEMCIDITAQVDKESQRKLIAETKIDIDMSDVTLPLSGVVVWALITPIFKNQRKLTAATMPPSSLSHKEDLTQCFGEIGFKLSPPLTVARKTLGPKDNLSEFRPSTIPPCLPLCCPT